jgi:hypothetical protein
VIAKISDPRGTRVGGLIWYLFGPGRREEHTDPHLVAGWRHPAELEPPLRPDGRRDFRRLCGLLQQPHAVLGPRGFDRPVWHCAVRAAPEDRMLSDDEWAQIAGDVMHRTGLSPCGQEDDGGRWVAVRHGADHIHIVAMLARQDGGKPRLSNERYRVREACRAAEERYGLRGTAPGDRTAACRPTRAEHEKTRRKGRPEAPRVVLRRAVSTAAAGSASEEEFFARLADAGLLVRQRRSTRDPGEVTGYAVALSDDTARGGGPVWFGGGKLAADLTLPKLRSRGPRQPHPAPGRRQLRPRRPCPVWSGAPEHARREQSAQDRSAASCGRHCRQWPNAGLGDTDHPTRRTRRGCRRTASRAATRRPGRQRPHGGRASARCRRRLPSAPADPTAAADRRRAGAAGLSCPHSPALAPGLSAGRGPASAPGPSASAQGKRPDLVVSNAPQTGPSGQGHWPPRTVPAVSWLLMPGSAATAACAISR